MTSLQLTSADLQKRVNAEAHKTNLYSTQELVLRRGWSFKFTCFFNKPVQSTDGFTITVEIGPSPSTSRNTRAVMTVSSSGSSTTWSAVRGSSSNNSLPITINIPVNAPVGHYKMKMQTTSGGVTSSHNMESFIVLFNAWHIGDGVYMADNALREEYLLTDYGMYWFGNSPSSGSRAWNYGQFEYGVLTCCTTLLDRTSFYATDKALDVSNRGDPLYVARGLSAVVNSNDGDNGVIVGSWTGNYSGGTSPTAWDGSVAILRKWMESGPVKYGQCWVFAGVLCTVYRALGIPARLVTNFASAHDTGRNLYIDTFYDSSGNKIPSMNQDSIWNFHCWTDIWAARPLLGIKYTGWQAMDATPQELSGGIYCLGPCSLMAVKDGEVDLDYDTLFVFTTVNGGEKHWTISSTGRRRLAYSNSDTIGRFISTKAPGSMTRLDITNLYKHPEGSAMEREVFAKAESKIAPAFSPAAAFAREMEVREEEIKPEFSGTFKMGEVQVGDDVIMELHFKSTSDAPMDLNVKITANSIIYTNKPVKEILTESQTVALGANEVKSIPFKITYNQYKDKITVDNMIDVLAMCEDDQGGKLLIEKMVKLKSPPLVFKIKEGVKVNKKSSVELLFTNPLDEAISNCILKVQGSGLLKEPVTIKVPHINKQQSHTFQLVMTPYRPGSRCIMADLSSDKLSSVKAYQSVPVAQA